MRGWRCPLRRHRHSCHAEPSRESGPGVGTPGFPEVLPAGSPLEAGRARRMAVAAALRVPVARGPGLPQSFAKLPGWQALPLGLSPRSWGCRAVPCCGRSGRAGPRQRCRPAPGTRCTPALAVALHAIHLHLAPWNRECVGQRGSPGGKRSPGLLSSSVSLQRLIGRWVKAASPRHGTRWVSGQRAAAAARGHAQAAWGALQAHQLPQKSAAGAEGREGEDGKGTFPG